jgi:hypothetical protein
LLLRTMLTQTLFSRERSHQCTFLQTATAFGWNVSETVVSNTLKLAQLLSFSEEKFITAHGK